MTASIALITVVTTVVVLMLAQDVRHHIASTSQYAVAPLQRTERSLANRFARGEITARDYERVLRLLRD